MVRTVMVDWNLLDRKPLFNSAKFKKRVSVKAFIQARLTSNRLPGKIYKDINGVPMLYRTIDMAKRCKLIDDVVIISPHKLPDLPESIGEFVFYGPEEDVLRRYVEAHKFHPCQYIVRLTSDCPILDPFLIDFVIASSLEADYGSNVLVPTFPDGMDTEVFNEKTLFYLDEHARSRYEREHVTILLRNNPQSQLEKNLISVQAFKDQSALKLSVDDEDDLARIKNVEAALCQK